MTERDLAVLVLDSKVVAAALAANCAGKASFNCPNVFDPSLTGLRLAEATQNMLCVQDAARLPNHGRRVTVPAPPQARLPWTGLWRWQRQLAGLSMATAQAGDRHLWWFMGAVG